MVFKEFLLFGLFFLLFPYVGAIFIQKKVFSNRISISSSYIVALLAFPAINAAVLAFLYVFMPKNSNGFYLLSILIVNVLIVFPFIKDIKNSFLEVLIGLKNKTYLKIFIIFNAFYLLILLSTIEQMGADILEYIEIGKVFYKDKSFFYPVTPHYPENFFSSHATHPPFFTILISFCYLLQNSADHYTLPNLFLSFYSIMSIAVLLLIMRKNLLWGLILIGFSYLTSVYAFHFTFMPNGIDPFRLCYFVFSFYLLQQFTQINKKSILILLGFFLGASLATHSSGLLFYILFLPIFLATYVERSSKKYSAFLILLSTSIIFGSPQYIKNFIDFGKPISDDVLIWSLYDYHFLSSYERNIVSFKSKLKQLIYVFKADRQAYGYIFSSFVLISFLFIKRIGKNFIQAGFNIVSYKQKKLNEEMPFFLFVFSFFSVVFISILFDMTLVIKNPRYLITAYPFVILMIFFSTEKFLSAMSLVKILKRTIVLINFLLDNLIKIQEKIITFIKKNKTLVRIFYFLFFICSVILIFHKYMMDVKIEKVFQKNPKSLENPIFKYLNNKLNENKQDTVLSFYRSGLYRNLDNPKVYFYLNDTLSELYKLDNVEELYKKIRKNNIKYIYFKNHVPYVYFQTAFQGLCSDPRYVSLALVNGTERLFKINKEIDEKSYFDTQKIFDSIFIQHYGTKSFEYLIKNDKNYLVEFIPERKSDIYTVKINTESFSNNYMINGESSIWLKTPKKKEDDENKKTIIKISIESKNQDISMKIKIKELKSNYVQK